MLWITKDLLNLKDLANPFPSQLNIIFNNEKRIFIEKRFVFQGSLIPDF